MASLVLLFVGSVLLVNGLVFLGRVEARLAAPINILTGLALTATVLFIVLPVRDTGTESLNAVIGAVGFLLFSFTYITVGFNDIFDLEGYALGWYCGWATLIAIFLSAANFARIDDARFGWLWLSWSVLFFAFFLALVTNMAWIAKPVGILTVLQSFTTCTVPAALMLTEQWSGLSLVFIAVVQLAVIVIFVERAVAARRRSRQFGAVS